MYIDSNASGPFALFLSPDRKFVNTSHNNIECFNANYISYVGNTFEIYHYRDIVNRQIYSRYLVIVLDVRCRVVFSASARTSQRTQPVPVMNIPQGRMCTFVFMYTVTFRFVTKIEMYQPILGKKIPDTKYNGNPSRRNLHSTRGSVA